jgi:hypothetical protein
MTERISEMPKSLVISTTTLIALLACSFNIGAQAATPQTAQKSEQQQSEDKWNQASPDKKAFLSEKAGLAPVRDLSGIWDAMAEGGVQPKGPREFVDDAKHVGIDVPYSPAGKAARMLNKPSEGEQQVPAGDTNDPIDRCEPQGFPRMELYDFREAEIFQSKDQVVLLDELDANYRIIWTDGRQLPKDPEPRWFGYSVGKWVDDFTFVVNTVGMDSKTWIDHVGRPHSDSLEVEERFHRVDFNTIELTMTINDPKYYTKPWIALNKFVLHRLPRDFDWIEYICSPAEAEQYRKKIGKPAADLADGK